MSTPITPAPVPAPAPAAPAPKAPWYKPWLAEAKVLAATAAAAGVGLVVAFLNGLPGNDALLSPLPGWAQAAVTLIVPTAATYLAGWAAKHTPRKGV